MRGATFLLVINFSIGLAFAAAFLGLSWRAGIALGRWCAAGFLCAAATVATEALVPLIPWDRFVSLVSFSLLMLALTLVAIGIVRHYRPGASVRSILGLFVVAEVLNLTIRYDLPRDTLAHGLIYQGPYAAMLSLSATHVFRAPRRGPADLVLAGVLVASALYFMAKALLPPFARSGMPEVRDYILSVYAYYSQTAGAVLSLLLGLSVLGVLISEVVRETARRLQHDSLSGTLNRAAFIERASAMLATPGPRRRACLIMSDLDHFKSINDRFGHAAGDEVIGTFGRVLMEEAGSGGLCGRLGGEEFGLLLPIGDAEQARERLAALRVAFAGRTFGLMPEGVRVTASFGAALAGAGEAFEDILRRADIALYAAKAAGRDRFVLADPRQRTAPPPAPAGTREPSR